MVGVLRSIVKSSSSSSWTPLFRLVAEEPGVVAVLCEGLRGVDVALEDFLDTEKLPPPRSRADWRILTRRSVMARGVGFSFAVASGQEGQFGLFLA